MTPHEEDRAFIRWLGRASVPQLCNAWTKAKTRWKRAAIARQLSMRNRKR